MSIAPAVREALGMDESADEDAVNAALLERLKTPAVTVSPPVQETAVVETPAIPAAPNAHPNADHVAASVGDLDKMIATAVSAAMADAKAGQETLRTELARVSAELADRKQAEATTLREQTITRAVSAGKIRPADRERFVALYDAAPQQTVDMLDALAPGTAVPISASGYAGDGDLNADEADKLIAAMGLGANL